MPTDAASWRELGELCIRKGRTMEARLCFEELALVLDTANVYNLITLGDVSPTGSHLLWLIPVCSCAMLLKL